MTCQQFSNEMENEITERVILLEDTFTFTIENINSSYSREQFLANLRSQLKEIGIKINNLQRANAGSHCNNEELVIEYLAINRILQS